MLEGNDPAHALFDSDSRGLLILMGQHDHSRALFYFFRLEDQVPESHLLRQIDKHVSFAFVREKLKATRGARRDLGLLLRILLIGYLYGITSEREPVELPTRSRQI